MKRKVYATKEIQFEAAHHLVNYDGDCSKVHGHSYKLKDDWIKGVPLQHRLSTSDADVLNSVLLDFGDQICNRNPGSL